MPKREIKWHPDDHLVVCDRSGFTYRMSECVVEPKTGLIVHRAEVDMPHPQQYRTPVKPDRQAVRPVRERNLTRKPSVGSVPDSIANYTNYVLANGELPDGTISNLPTITDEIDGSTTNYEFLSTNQVDPNSL